MEVGSCGMWRGIVLKEAFRKNHSIRSCLDRHWPYKKVEDLDQLHILDLIKCLGAQFGGPTFLDPPDLVEQKKKWFFLFGAF